MKPSLETFSLLSLSLTETHIICHPMDMCMT